MKCTLLTFFIFLITINPSNATGQAEELIIYRGDTLPLLSLPLETYLGDYESRESKFQILNTICSTALWRNYQALWKIQNEELILIDVFLCAERNQSIMSNLFGSDHPTRANWYSGNLNIQIGEMVKYHHSGFSRYYEEEIVMNVNDGKVTGHQYFKNGYKSSDLGIQSPPDSIMFEFYNRINWDSLTLDDSKIFVGVTTANPDSLYIERSLAPQNNLAEVLRIIAEFPKLKPFYVRGEPLKERFIIPLIFSDEHRKLYGR